MKRFLNRFTHHLNRALMAPLRVLWICLGLLTASCVIDGSLLRLWALHRDYRGLEANMTQLEAKGQDLRKRLARAKDPSFLEREARDRFDLVSEGDLVFVFSEE